MEDKMHSQPPEENRDLEFVYTEQDHVQAVCNNQLECAGCIHALPQTGFCKKYRPKPDYVLLRKGPCPGFESAAPIGTESEECTVVHVPQCVGCAYHLGGCQCGMFVQKPEERVMNTRACPARLPAEKAL